ncbi:glycosyltransferase [Mobilicoccus massiliensis]|uniref:glycosyltransferase n=1 Tax=Mobilicoccus massiliensis TaxID=1522310 RepID=UPI00058F33BE|nr:glycosyltransferase [Mobilicoccus massiliensis]
METPSLACCLVLGDDARDLHGCLASLSALGDLLAATVVVGVGASTRTLDFARRAGAKVVSRPDDGDLAAARNEAAELAGTPWVFVLDGDDRVSADPAMLGKLLVAQPGEVVRPDALQIEVQGADTPASREIRLYRTEACHYVGGIRPRLVAREAGRTLRPLNPGADVVRVSCAHGDDPAGERARLQRREARATRIIEVLDAEGGDELVSALVERARARRGLGDGNGALADLNRARSLPCGDRYRDTAREELVGLLIEHRHFTGARTLISQLRSGEADAGYSDWLEAQVSAAEGQASEALRIVDRLRDRGLLTRADGGVVAPPEILNETMILAARVHDYDKAFECCLELVSRHGQVRRYGRLLLKLWGARSPESLATRLVEAGAPIDPVAAALRSLPDPGPAAADALEARRPELTQVAASL